jgi:hypothetical protein
MVNNIGAILLSTKPARKSVINEKMHRRSADFLVIDPHGVYRKGLLGD